MSVALAFAKDRKIYLAVDRKGVPYQSIPSKLFSLQQHPEVWAVCTGGIEHWHDVTTNYKPQPSLIEAAEHVRNLLERFTIADNDAHALVCGFENGAPGCYLVERLQGSDRPEKCEPRNLDQVQVIGKQCVEVGGRGYYIAAMAKQRAEEHLKGGLEPMESLIKAIDDVMPIGKLAGCLDGPVDYRAIEEPQSL